MTSLHVSYMKTDCLIFDQTSNNQHMGQESVGETLLLMTDLKLLSPRKYRWYEICQNKDYWYTQYQEGTSKLRIMGLYIYEQECKGHANSAVKLRFASRVKPYPARIVWPCYFDYIGLVNALKWISLYHWLWYMNNKAFFITRCETKLQHLTSCLVSKYLLIFLAPQKDCW